MPISNVTQWSSTPASNTDIGGISLDGAVMTPSQVDNAIRELMAQVAGGISASYFIPAVMTLPKIWDTSATHKYSFGVSELAADRTVTLPLLAGNDTFVFEAHAQTLTNKTLTSPTINTPTITNPTLTLKQSATPTPTADGDIQWDTDDNVLAVGDGASTQVFVPIPASTAAGDIEYYSGAKAKARLAKGSAGQVLAMNAGATGPEWKTLSIPTPDYASGNAALSVGGVGTYSLLMLTTGIVALGGTAAGSDLRYTDVSMTSPTGIPSGTWRNMAKEVGASKANLFLRIA